MLDRLQRLILDTPDFDAAVSAYETLLATRPTIAHDTHDTSDATTARQHAFFDVTNTTLEIRSAPSGDAAPSSALAELVFQTPDLDFAHRHLDAAALAMSPRSVHQLTIDTEPPHPVTWHQFFLDPASTGGVHIHLADSAATALWTRDRVSDTDSDATAVTGLDHVVVRSRDADATRAFYGEQLGIRVAVDREFPQWGVRLIFCKVGDLILEIASRLSSAEGSSSPLDSDPDDSSAYRDALWGCTWRVANADAARSRLASAGLDVSEVRQGRRPGTRVFTVRSGTAGIPTLMIEPV